MLDRISGSNVLQVVGCSHSCCVESLVDIVASDGSGTKTLGVITSSNASTGPSYGIKLLSWSDLTVAAVSSYMESFWNCTLFVLADAGSVPRYVRACFTFIKKKQLSAW